MTAVAHATAANVGSTTTAVLPPKPASDPLANEETFLKLLVSQLKNQDPLSPRIQINLLASLRLTVRWSS